MASLDASKPFDRINQEKLFVKLSDRGAPQYFIRKLQHWYSKLTSCVRWNGILSGVFRVACGVRQGGILSPFLFSIYVDELLYLLSTSSHGCHVGTVFYERIMYADDLILSSPSLCSLQVMTDICSDYAIKHFLFFICKKTVFTIVNKPKYAVSDLTLDCHIIQLSDYFKYLGVHFIARMDMSVDIMPVRRKFYVASNSIIARSHGLAEPV